MTFSVNTNTGALTALQYLTATQGALGQDPDRHQQRPEGRHRP